MPIYPKHIFTFKTYIYYKRTVKRGQAMNSVLSIFPPYLKDQVEAYVKNHFYKLQEIRLRQNQPIEFIFDDYIGYIQSICNYDDFSYIVNQLSEYSLYRLADELREGYITINGGHRVGLAGQVITENGSVKAIKHIRFLNIRIAKEKLNVAKPIMHYLYEDNYLNTLLVGPPQSGKTTYLRDITRLISSGWGKVSGKKVALIDERSEIAACKDGIPQHNVGKRTDVMDACPKAEGMMMMIRSMSPDIIVVDEIGSNKDVAALLEAINAGITIVCTVHGSSIEELKRRPSLRKVFQEHIFERIVLLQANEHGNRIKSIYDEKERTIFDYKRRQSNEMVWSNYPNRNIDNYRV